MNKRTGFSLLTGIVGILLLAGMVWSQGGAFTLRRQTVAAGRADMISPNFTYANSVCPDMSRGRGRHSCSRD